MFCSLPIEDPATGRRGLLFVEVFPWAGYTVRFHFYDSLAHNEGTVEFDALKRSVKTMLTQPACTLNAMDRVTGFFRDILPRYTPGYTISLEEIAGLYGKHYYSQHGYAFDLAVERRLKQIFAEAIAGAIRPHKVLVAGCAAGEEVRAFRAIGAEAWGFDIGADLIEGAYPDVRPFVRVGSLHAIPFDPGDGFDLLTAFDVFEHVPEHLVPAMVADIARVDPRYLVTLINHVDFFEEGHVTLRPLEWWVQAFQEAYRLVPLDVDFSHYPELYQVPGAIRHRMRLWQRVGGES